MTRTSSILFWFALTIVVSVALYNTSYRVQELNQQLRSLNTQIESEQANIHVLKAEWVYLANPARIEIAARKYLDMNPTAMSQIKKVENLPEIIPTRKEAMAGTAIEGTPIASIKSIMPTKYKTASRRDTVAEQYNHINTHMVIQRIASSSGAEAIPYGIMEASYGNDQ